MQIIIIIFATKDRDLKSLKISVMPSVPELSKAPVIKTAL